MTTKPPSMFGFEKDFTNDFHEFIYATDFWDFSAFRHGDYNFLYIAFARLQRADIIAKLLNSLKRLLESVDGLMILGLSESLDRLRQADPSRPRHREVKLCFVRLAKRPNRNADDDLVDCLRLAGVTGDSYSLVEMQSGLIANNLAFIEYDLAIRWPDQERSPRVFRSSLICSQSGGYKTGSTAPELTHRPLKKIGLPFRRT